MRRRLRRAAAATSVAGTARDRRAGSRAGRVRRMLFREQVVADLLRARAERIAAIADLRAARRHRRCGCWRSTGAAGRDRVRRDGGAQCATGCRAQGGRAASRDRWRQRHRSPPRVAASGRAGARRCGRRDRRAAGSAPESRSRSARRSASSDDRAPAPCRRNPGAASRAGARPSAAQVRSPLLSMREHRAPRRLVARRTATGAAAATAMRSRWPAIAARTVAPVSAAARRQPRPVGRVDVAVGEPPRDVAVAAHHHHRQARQGEAG